MDFFGSLTKDRIYTKRKEILNGFVDPPKFTSGYRQFGYDYFDNPSIGIGYGGYLYDGRYNRAAANMIAHYRLAPRSKVLEVGCAKGYLLSEFKKREMGITGIDLSLYATKNAPPDVRCHLMVGDISRLPFDDHTFDLVVGKEILPHVPTNQIQSAITECLRVSKGNTFFEIQTGRTAEELEMIKQWDCTHLTIQPPQWWQRQFNDFDQKVDVNYKILFPMT